jgi:hypothetical protein
MGHRSAQDESGSGGYATVKALPTGVLLPESFLHTQFFLVLATFVAINTIVYVVLAIAKILPKIYVSDWIRGANRRAETRSIHPDAPVGEPPVAPLAHRHDPHEHPRHRADRVAVPPEPPSDQRHPG